MEFFKIIKIITIILVWLFFCFLGYRLCYLIAEKFFFDKFFYQKSVYHGYWVMDKNYAPQVSFKDFGHRAEDVDNLEKNIPIKTDPNKYNIAIFSDSLAWGQGVIENNRFPILLEKKLNKIKPTKIYSFSSSGDNIFNHFLKYQQAVKNYSHFDLYIFGLYYNDLELNFDNRLNTNDFIFELAKECTGKKIYDFVLEKNQIFLTRELETFKTDSFNFCAFKKIAPLMPKEKSIYIDLGNIYVNWGQPTQQQFKEIISSNIENCIEPPYLPICDKNHYCQVSRKDQHPSPYIHKKYADILFDQITTNSKFNFKVN